MPTPPIAILGAGPSGLTLARLLEVCEIDYTVFERDISPSATRAGGTLDLHTTAGLKALHEAGLLNEFKKYARYDAQSFIFADSQGRTLKKHDVNPGGTFLEGKQTERPEIDRLDLRNILLASIPATRIKWGVKVASVWREPHGAMSVRSVDGTVESGFKLVVGADGAWSKARRLITPAKPVYYGYYYITTNISPKNPFNAQAMELARTGNYMAFGNGKLVTAQPLRDGTVTVNVGINLPETWQFDNASLLANADDTREWLLREHFSDWSPTITGLLKHSDSDFHPWPMYSMPAETVPWTHVPGVTLIGDAAHLTYCSLSNGEGVNLAMHDSIELVNAIQGHGLDSLDAAVIEYEQAMFPRAAEHIADGPNLWRMLTASDAPREVLKLFEPRENVARL
ncbi:FAD/NAD(P)-binding domain-containing protein [Teratosphaeria nubilosa]|uniref:FAD/NAD(P)-binding domain-containing protein n=1 Tax=Teratosphaeria nubilosa TaxID=161662 RepID=A0A6G1LEE2_9PEZI|nr:FAD/NAD(P)-binding domain-containing protein [Teratosphaeria nubilosa]